MASIRREVSVAAGPAVVWDAIRDVGAVHERLAPGFVVDTKLEEGARLVTFGNGVVARELIVDVDDEARRLAWAGGGWPDDPSQCVAPGLRRRRGAQPGRVDRRPPAE
jgi:hypothetical protein